MRKSLFFIFALSALVFSDFSLKAQNIVYSDASAFTIINRPVEGGDPYERVPVDNYPSLSAKVRNYYSLSTGLAISFRTDSPVIYARWESTVAKVGYNMTSIMAKGMDLYIRRDGEWVYAGFAKPSAGVEHESVMVKSMDDSMKECLLYLPLFDRVNKLEIGVAEGCVLEAGENPFRHKIVVAGSSITHGASSSRPALAYVSWLERMTGFEFCNLGASGQFQMDDFFVDVLKDVKCDALIIDAFSNPSVQMIEERVEGFVRKVRELQPDIPIIYLETLDRESCNFDMRKRESETLKKAAARKAMKKLVKELDGVYYIENAFYTGSDHENSVDTVHPTDLGFHIALQGMEPKLRKILKKHGIR